ncbi:MAG TPA: hypothetical protein VNH18_35320 [Bryobacteraceae bacterium]|nr:hypothetical protein [Bryobacteraceae bacterium]
MSDAELKVVEGREILAEEGGRISLAPLQRVGVRGALSVGVVATAVLLILLVRWIWLEPAIPNVPAGMDEKQVAAIMSRYKELQSINIDNTIKMIDAVIMKILLPVFASFVGYVFGSQSGSKSSD